MTHSLWWFNAMGILEWSPRRGIGDSSEAFRTRESLLTWLKRSLTICIMTVNPYPQTVYMMANLDNIIEAAFSIYYVFVGLGMFAQYVVLVRNRWSVRQLVRRLERIANDSNFIQAKSVRIR